MLKSLFYTYLEIFIPGFAIARSAICFLTRQSSPQMVEFAFELAQNIPSVDVFVIVDNSTHTTLPILSSMLRFLQFSDTICTKYGFQRANVADSVEEDVFISSIQAFLSLHELYSSYYDFVTAEVEYNIHGNSTEWPRWRLASGTFILPWAHGMVCAMGYNHMRIVTPLELDTIVYRENYTFEQIQARPNNWWYSINNFDQQKEWRKRLINNSMIDTKGVLITLNSIKKQLNYNDITKSTDEIESQMLSLLAQLEIVKGHIKSSSRHQLREEFLQLITNQSDKLTSIAVLLDDHAFKFPHSLPDKNIIKNKTSIHVKLEKLIENNKQMILQLMKNDNPTQGEMLIIQ
ncbi:unnamed protein product [Rotaria sp. Silwood1]|nr:unnamed protein product [Rotaria sp. Silwood1]CAF4531387.1 unnamed protein product [Rotaria sp. Silwood1]